MHPPGAGRASGSGELLNCLSNEIRRNQHASTGSPGKNAVHWDVGVFGLKEYKAIPLSVPLLIMRNDLRDRLER